MKWKNIAVCVLVALFYFVSLNTASADIRVIESMYGSNEPIYTDIYHLSSESPEFLEGIRSYLNEHSWGKRLNEKSFNSHHMDFLFDG
ncbi:MAG: hypothetical protein GFH27_549309n142 [Chloroflexi bacterium AL-W]|nr:hypothetical protein [Chloroflexi bacterium AL-N1]NOK69844.1 hypothetical protein [Chloroflexi bacterium AL-N10]NOK73552.1 hypothetical protein [Chloroflexi bacterium AL-N5]NOK84014.1 hypothetical protein [Chloroflexi bacterium AL-W]NOK87883.1 hypothetical protein [Chloroflexi bacterium AL-N15]